MKTLLIIAALLFLVFRILRGLGRMREMEQDVYCDANRRANEKRRSEKKKSNVKRYQMPA